MNPFIITLDFFLVLVVTSSVSFHEGTGLFAEQASCIGYSTTIFVHGNLHFAIKSNWTSMQHNITLCCITQGAKQGGFHMLKMTMSPQEYIQIGENIRIIFTGGSKNNMHILIDAPREINIVRSKVLEQRIKEGERKTYYRDEDKSEKYRKKTVSLEGDRG